jgi:hypothetical protein
MIEVFSIFESLIDIKMEVHSEKTPIIYVQAKYLTTSSLEREVTVTRDG